MAWHSIYHDGDSTLGDMGHVGPYDMDVLNAIAAGLNMDVTGQGPYLATASLGGFLCTGAVSPLTLSSGLGNVNGRLVLSDANSSIAVDTPDAATRWDVLCLQYDPATNQVLPFVHQGVEGAGAYPTLTQDGTAWEVPLWGVKITTMGAITLEDLREWVQHATRVTDAQIANLSISRGKLAALERYVLVPPSRAWNATDASAITSDANVLYGTPMIDNKVCEMAADFHVPADWDGISDIRVYPVVITAAGVTGNVVNTIIATWGSGGQAYNTHGASTGPSTEAIATAEYLTALLPVTMALADINVADIVTLYYQRAGTDGDDTVGDTVYFVGFDVRYTSK